MERIEKILMNNGFKKQEIKIYLALLRLRETQTGKLCEETGIASSNIYGLLKSMQKKGLVSYKMKNDTKIFMPSPIESLKQIFTEKEKELKQEKKEVLEYISRVKEESAPKEESTYKYYEGIAGIKAMWYEINSAMDKNNIIKIHTPIKRGYEILVGFYDEHQKIRKGKKVEERMIFPLDDTTLAKKRTKDKLVKIRFMDIKNEAEWGIVKDIFFMQYVNNKNPVGFLIKDKTFAKTFELAFDNLWEQAKP